MAAKRGSVDAVRYLFYKGADVNIKDNDGVSKSARPPKNIENVTKVYGDHPYLVSLLFAILLSLHL